MASAASASAGVGAAASAAAAPTWNPCTFCGVQWQGGGTTTTCMANGDNPQTCRNRAVGMAVASKKRSHGFGVRVEDCTNDMATLYTRVIMHSRSGVLAVEKDGQWYAPVQRCAQDVPHTLIEGADDKTLALAKYVTFVWYSTLVIPPVVVLRGTTAGEAVVSGAARNQLKYLLKGDPTARDAILSKWPDITCLAPSPPPSPTTVTALLDD